MRESSRQSWKTTAAFGGMGAGGGKDTGRSRAKRSKELRTQYPLPPGEVAGV
jgi:hypothetical protein